MSAASETFELAVEGFTAPDLPKQPTDLDRDRLRDPEIAAQIAATTPLVFSLILPHARANNPLHPATHLQLIYHYKGTGDVYLSDEVKPADLIKHDEDPCHKVYVITIPANGVKRIKVNPGATGDATVRLDAWRFEKLLSSWTIGQIPGLGLVGLKDFPLHYARMEQWQASNKRTTTLE